MTLEPLRQAVRQALLLCREVQHSALRGMDKTSARASEPVTLADYGAQAIIGRALATHYPDDAVLAEESGAQFLDLVAPEQRAIILSLLMKVLDEPVREQDILRWLDHGRGRSAARTWTVDPVDGTKGFLALRHYAVGVGLLTDGQPTGAVIGCPAYGDGISGNDEEGLLFDVEDGQARAWPLFGPGAPAVLRASGHTAPDAVTLVQSFEEKHGNKARKARIYALAGYANAALYELDSMEKYALIAAGRADVCLHTPRGTSTFNVWDHAPGIALVQAAGGCVTGLDGAPLDCAQGAVIPCRGIVITSGAALHERILAAVAQVYADGAED
ncbi:MAG: hypothetical protein MUE40_14125 [Anaerolineae bacterium]|jgi:3'(2'), 5'-bisphosphate nucleotidase|nr:hypothetical protein [Anaerolineae bacterium]